MIEHYDPQTEEWPEYVECVQHFFDANGLEAVETNMGKRRSTFLTLIGPTTYKVLRSLIEPSCPQDKTFEELVEVLMRRCSMIVWHAESMIRVFRRNCWLNVI